MNNPGTRFALQQGRRNAMSEQTTKVSMIVAERGTDWTPWAEWLRTRMPDVVVVVQRQGESVGELAMRVRARIDDADAQGQVIESAVMVGGTDGSDDVLASRSLALRAMASSMVRAGGGKIWLDGGPSSRGRWAMASLAEIVNEQLRLTGVTVLPVDRAVEVRKVA
jgi:hypothetical protein